MISLITRNWWAPVVRGLAALVFGILAFAMPGITLAGLILLFGAYALVDGVFAILSTITKRSSSDAPWWALLLEGVVGIGMGIVAFFWPGITAMSLLYVIAAWSLVTGILEIVAAVRLRKEIKGEWLLGLGGVLSILFAVGLVAWPMAGALALVWMIGAYAIVFGIVMIMFGFRLRTLHADADRTGTSLGSGRLSYR